MRTMKLAAVTGSLALVFITPTAFASTSQTRQYVETNHGWVDYHSAAGLNSPVLGRLQLGDKAPLIKKADAYWYEVQWNGRDVYITTNSNFTHMISQTVTTSKPAPAPAPTIKTTGSQSTTSYVETNHGWVDYHSAAKLSSPVLGRLQLGDKAPLVKKADTYWYEIQWNGKDVYITTNSNYTHVVTGSSPSIPGASTSGVGTSPAPTKASGSTTATPSWQVQANKVIATAKTQLGVPYLWGKQEPGIGFDCSNFTAWSFRTALGIRFSGSSVTQRNSVGTPVALGSIREGDLLFFKTKNNPTGGGHVGIYMGNGMVIQEGGGWGKVTIEPLSGTWLGRDLVFARRVIQ